MPAGSKSLLPKTVARHPRSELYTIHHADRYAIDVAIRLPVIKGGAGWLRFSSSRDFKKTGTLGQEACCSGEYSSRLTRERITHILGMAMDLQEHQSLSGSAPPGAAQCGFFVARNFTR